MGARGEGIRRQGRLRITLKTTRLLVAACLALAPLAAFAQDYPVKPIRIIIPLTPGSGADIAGRIIAKHMGDAWKQPVLVENRPGAGGLIGTQAVVNSDPDGYTLLVQSASHAANPAIYKSLPYDPLKDIVDIAILGGGRLVLGQGVEVPNTLGLLPCLGCHGVYVLFCPCGASKVAVDGALTSDANDGPNMAAAASTATGWG